jgi:hypothetical protein
MRDMRPTRKNQMITPQTVENRLGELSKEIDTAHEDLVKAEKYYHTSKAVFEIAIARSRIKIGMSNMKLKVGDVADRALLECELEWTDIQAAEALVKAARGNAQRVRTQVDIARSIGTSVRASMDI